VRIIVSVILLNDAPGVPRPKVCDPQQPACNHEPNAPPRPGKFQGNSARQPQIPPCIPEPCANLLGPSSPPFYSSPMVHVGIGYDVHALVEGRRLILGGVQIPHPKGLEGHSDADVLMHAICDAVLGALGEPDIGHLFPNTDPRWHGVASQLFLQEAGRLASLRQGKIINLDATVIAQAPKLFPHIQDMKINIAAALELNIRQVGIKATTNERLGFLGREEGIAAMAVASVDLP